MLKFPLGYHQIASNYKVVLFFSTVSTESREVREIQLYIGCIKPIYTFIINRQIPIYGFYRYMAHYGLRDFWLILMEKGFFLKLLKFCTFLSSFVHFCTLTYTFPYAIFSCTFFNFIFQITFILFQTQAGWPQSSPKPPWGAPSGSVIDLDSDRASSPHRPYPYRHKTGLSHFTEKNWELKNAGLLWCVASTSHRMLLGARSLALTLIYLNDRQKRGLGSENGG